MRITAATAALAPRVSIDVRAVSDASMMYLRSR